MLLCRVCYLQPFSSEGRAGLDLPHTIPDGLQMENFGQLRHWNGRRQVLLVGKDQQWYAGEQFLLKQLGQLLQDNTCTHILQANFKLLISNSASFVRSLMCHSSSPDLSLQIALHLSCRSRRSATEIKPSSHASTDLTSENRASQTHQDVCVLEIIPPIGPDLPLTSNVPNIQPEAVRLHTL